RPLGYQVGELLMQTAIYDDEREELCDFLATEEGGDSVLRCVPTTFGELRYTSADCNDGERILIRESATRCGRSVQSGAILRAASPTDCGANQLVVRRLGAAATDSTYYRREYGSGDCVVDDI